MALTKEAEDLANKLAERVKLEADITAINTEKLAEIKVIDDTRLSLVSVKVAAIDALKIPKSISI